MLLPTLVLLHPLPQVGMGSDNLHPPQVDTKPASDVIAGAVARAASQGTIHPLDTLKVRLQSGKSLKPVLAKASKLIQPQGASCVDSIRPETPACSHIWPGPLEYVLESQ